jgi:hypothetical protein
MIKANLKAYIVSDKWDDCSIIVWAENSNKAKSIAIYDDCLQEYGYTDVKAQRAKDFDEYVESKKVPIQKMLDNGWYFSCCKCGKRHLDQNSIDKGEAFIIDSDIRNDFVLGNIICVDCKKRWQTR